MIIKLNGTTIGSQTRDVNEGWLRVSPDANQVLIGWNQITVKRTAGDFTITKIHLYVSYDASDEVAPTPDSMTWATEPNATGTTTITMTASTATDAENNGVEYYFECTVGGGNDSGWQSDPVYTDTGLTPGTQYTYRVKARDRSLNQNETGFSNPASATTTILNVADINEDGEVNGIDFAIFALAWQSNDTPTSNWNPACELAEPANGIIDGLDLKVLMDNWLSGH